jgi:Protein of unknown function (DUF1579)
MKRILIAAFAGAFLIACNNEKKDDKTTDGTKETTTENTTEKAWVPIDSAMMMKAWQESMVIGEPHKMLAKGNGTWTGEVTMWMADGAPPQTSTSTTVTESMYGGLYSKSKHSGNMMGSPFEGSSITAYDNMKKEFVSTWIDNMGSGILVMTGQWDDASKKLNLSGSFKCMNGQDGTMREVFTFVDDDHQTLEMYGPDPATGKEYKNMEIKYTRKK